MPCPLEVLPIARGTSCVTTRRRLTTLLTNQPIHGTTPPLCSDRPYRVKTDYAMMPGRSSRTRSLAYPGSRPGRGCSRSPSRCQSLRPVAARNIRSPHSTQHTAHSTWCPRGGRRVRRAEQACNLQSCLPVACRGDMVKPFLFSSFFIARATGPAEHRPTATRPSARHC